jgi:hypothetical protein
MKGKSEPPPAPPTEPELRAVSPLFRLSSDGLFWFEPVIKLGATGKRQPRVLLIATVGVFLLKKRAPNKPYSISRAVPYQILLFLRCDGTNLQFIAAKISFTIDYLQPMHVVSMVSQVRTVLFGDKPRPLKIVSDGATAPQLASTFKYSPTCRLADRFLALILPHATPDLRPEAIDVTYASIANRPNPRVFTFDTFTISSPFIESIIGAVAVDPDLDELVISAIDFAAFLPLFIRIIRSNTSASRLTIQKVFFKGSFSEWANVWLDTTTFSVRQLAFRNCDLTSPDFAVFLRALNHYPGDLTVLSISNCRVDADTLAHLYRIITAAGCFRALSHLLLDGVSVSLGALIDFADSAAIAAISLADCGFEIAEILPRLTHIRSVSLAGNQVAGNRLAAPLSMADFRAITELNLSRTPLDVLNLFHCLSDCQNAPRRLLLDGLRVRDWGTVYDGMADLQLPNLELLSWQGNPLTEQSLAQFNRFLKNQGRLSFLSLSDCFPPDKAGAACLEGLAAVPLTGLELRGRKFSYGDALVPLLKAFLGLGTLSFLDVSDQKMGDAGLSAVAALAEGRLRAVWFDGNRPARVDQLLAVLSRLAVSNLQICQWPAETVDELLSPMKPQMAKPILGQLELLREMLAKQFPVPVVPGEIVLEQEGVRPFLRAAGVIAAGEVGVRESVDRRLLEFREEAIAAQLEEYGEKDSAVMDCLAALEAIAAGVSH